MKYLLDTHILLWMANADSALSKKVRDILSDESCDLFVSVASVWEMAIKISLKKLELPVTLDAFVQEQIINNGIQLLSIKTSHIYLLEELPFFHRDPFDRIIACQAKKENLTLISHDKAFLKYKVPCIS